MTKNTMKTAAVAAGTMLFDDWFDPIEDAVRERVRGVIETIMEEELDATLSRPRYGRRKAAGSIDDAAPIVGSRHGHRTRTLTGTFGKTEIAVPRARIKGEDGRARAARQEGHVDFASRGAGRAGRWPEGAAGGQEYGRRKRGSLASGPRRSCQTWPEDAGTRHRRRRPGAGCGAGCVVVRYRDSALHGAQASQPSRACAGAAARADRFPLAFREVREGEELVAGLIQVSL